MPFQPSPWMRCCRSSISWLHAWRWRTGEAMAIFGLSQNRRELDWTIQNGDWIFFDLIYHLKISKVGFNQCIMEIGWSMKMWWWWMDHGNFVLLVDLPEHCFTQKVSEKWIKLGALRHFIHLIVWSTIPDPAGTTQWFFPAEETAFQRTLDELLLRLAQKGSPALWPLISLRNGAEVPKLPGDEGKVDGFNVKIDGGYGGTNSHAGSCRYLSSWFAQNYGQESVIGPAQRKGLLFMHCSQLRDFANGQSSFRADTSKVDAATRVTTKCRNSKTVRPVPWLWPSNCLWAEGGSSSGHKKVVSSTPGRAQHLEPKLAI